MSDEQPEEWSLHQRRGPRFSRHRGLPWIKHRHSRDWHARRRWFFIRVLGFVAILGVLVIAGMAILAFLLTTLIGGDGQIVWLVWLGGVGLALVLPLLALGMGLRTVRGFAVPLTNIVAALDAAADGDLSVRVPEDGRREMDRLARSFNRMIGELERTDQQRRNLTADVAHELRTPLHIIQGNLEGILDGIYPADRAQIEATLEETRLLSRLVDDLRTLSLAEAGELPLHRQNIDVADLLADVVTSFDGQAEAQGIALRASIPAAPLLLYADADRLDQILSNLVANALRHTPSGGTVVLAAQRADNGIDVSVTDSGEGIAPQDLPFLFDRFWRGDPARTHTPGSGSGLGLSIANQLVKAHGAEIDVSSQIGEGTRFVIRFPDSAS